MTANLGVYTYPMHRSQHGWVKPSDCPFCAGEAYRATQEMDAWEAARAQHPSNTGRTPGNLAYWDQVNAAKRDDQASARRGLVTALLILAAFVTVVPGAVLSWAWFTNLGPVTGVHLAGPALLIVTALAVYGEYPAAVAYVCKYIGKQGEKPAGRWYYSGGDLVAPAVEYVEISPAELAAAYPGKAFVFYPPGKQMAVVNGIKVHEQVQEEGTPSTT